MAARFLAVLCLLGSAGVVSTLQHAAPLTQGSKAVLPEIDTKASHGSGAAVKLRAHSEVSAPQFSPPLKAASAVAGGEVARSKSVPFRGAQGQGSLEQFYLEEVDVEEGHVIGEGAVGRIRQGSWRGQPVALKALKEGFEPGANECSDFMRECEIGVRLQHRNVVGVHGLLSRGEEHPVIVQELMSGGTVEEVLTRRQAQKGCPWPPQREQLLGWCQDLARALAYLHSQDRKVLHRDIKPANLMLTQGEKTLKLGDFGLSRAVDGGSSAEPYSMSGQVGTIRFMAPEVYSSNAHYTEKVDVYSAAMCFYTMATGEKPFAEYTDMGLGAKVANGLRPSIVAVEWKPLASLIQRAWAVKPEDRPSAAEMLAELTAMEKELREDSSDPVRPRPSRSSSGAAFGGGGAAFSHIRMG